MKRSIQPALFMIFGIILVFAFQNCQQSGSFNAKDLSTESLDSVSTAEFFAYPYLSEPKFYMDIVLLRPTNAINLNEFRFLGTVTYPAKQTNVMIQYTVQIKTIDGLTVCPITTGTLLSGDTSIEFDCVSLRGEDGIVVKLSVSAEGKQGVLEQTYH